MANAGLRHGMCNLGGLRWPFWPGGITLGPPHGACEHLDDRDRPEEYLARCGPLSPRQTFQRLPPGAAGQAIQNANRLYGFPEVTGLTAMPLYP